MLRTENALMHELRPNETIYSIIRHVSNSGMTRHISFFRVKNENIYWITHDIHKLLGYKMNKYYDAIVVRGCGMDMAFSVVNNLEFKMNEDFYKANGLGSEFKLKSRII